MDEHGPVGPGSSHPGRHRQVGVSRPRVVDLARGYDESSRGGESTVAPRADHQARTRADADLLTEVEAERRSSEALFGPLDWRPTRGTLAAGGAGLQCWSRRGPGWSWLCARSWRSRGIAHLEQLVVRPAAQRRGTRDCAGPAAARAPGVRSARATTSFAVHLRRRSRGTRPSTGCSGLEGSPDRPVARAPGDAVRRRSGSDLMAHGRTGSSSYARPTGT